ncbi:MAG: response regulator [Caulobacteraceae bacterium]|nr:response regulator [Caulobacter sp.]
MSEPEVRINLSRARLLLVDASPQGLGILNQLVAGLGARLITKCTGAAAAAAHLTADPYDLLIIDADLPGPVSGYDLVRRLRRNATSPNQQSAVILLCGHTPAKSVARARDCGVSLLIAKPVSPKVVLDRIRWLARDRRDFVDCGDIYVGPDRRFHEQPEPPGGRTGRRREDAAPDPNKEASA